MIRSFPSVVAWLREVMRLVMKASSNMCHGDLISQLRYQILSELVNFTHIRPRDAEGRDVRGVIEFGRSSVSLGISNPLSTVSFATQTTQW